MDKTLLDKDGTPTIDELKDFFKGKDYSTAVSSFDHEKADDETNQTYLRAKKLFSKFWCENMSAFGGKGSFKNFSTNYPLKCLERLMKIMLPVPLWRLWRPNRLPPTLMMFSFLPLKNR